MSTSELYTKGARVWISDADLVWKAAHLLEDYVDQKVLRVQYEDGSEEGTIKVSEKTLPHLRNPEILIGENDLTSLSYLNEPEVLYNLKVRFAEQNMIYTYCGIVLVAINPYEYLDIYSNDIIQAYSGQDMGTMDPHIFAVSDEAFKQMSRFDRNQSIIVSGESGAGKTVSAKFAMRYFATVGGLQAETQVEKKVLASNPIMEAIGNAKTTRNDNSSRFGKYIEISFSKQHSIVGAHMRTYLLEKSRVVFQASEERNYHIFYQLCASAGLPEFKEFHLQTADDFFYTRQGAAPQIQNVNDAEEIVKTRDAFKTLGFSQREQMMIFQILSAVLHFGNINIRGKGGETCEIPANNTSITIMCKLLGIEESQMRMWLCHRKIQTVNETLIKPLTEPQASFARDALVKTVYSRLFDWIVTKINKALLTSAKSHKFIGILDIYGFETFEVNSFEQFCINYANEKLQQIFNMHVFKLEQEEYVREEIQWSFIDFYDNQPCIDLIESKLGILDLLDDECKMPKGSDANWCQKLYDKHLNKSHHFEKPRLSRSAFIINHFADKVQYQSDGFLEKNRDTVMEEQISMLKASEYELVAALFVEDAEGEAKTGRSVANTQTRAGSKQNKRTVGSQFRDSLCALMETLNATMPHYIRCIKPNDVKEAFMFDPKRAVEQLRACGVLETIRISAAGYPSRWTYPEFFQRYRVLAQSKQVLKNDIRKTCEVILAVLIPDEDKYRFGKTKIFFRAGQVAYLEKLRTTKLQACGVMIQKHVRGWLQRCKYHRVRRSVLLVQTFGRGLLARRYATFLRKTKAATLIQAIWRGHRDRKIYISTCSAVVVIQAHVQALFARKQYLDLRRHCRALALQKNIRAFVQRQKFQRVMLGIVLVQSHFRRRKARAQLKTLKAEAKSVDHIKQVNKGLENKIIELQQKLNEKTKQALLAKHVEGEMCRLKEEVERLRNTEEIVKFSSNKITNLEELLARLREDFDKIQSEKRDWVSEKEEMRLRHEKMIDSIVQEKTTLKEELDEAKAKIKGLEETIQGLAKEKTTAANNVLVHEFESERAHHQKLVSEHTRLQQRFKNLQDEVQVLKGRSKGHRHSESDTSGISVDSDVGSMADIDHKQGEKMAEEIDVGLLLRLQSRVKDLEIEKNEMKKKLESVDENVLQSSFVPDSAFYSLRMQELQNETEKQKQDIARLMKSISETVSFSDSTKKSKSKATVEFLAQFESMTEEFERRRAECLQLKTMLADRSITTHSIAKESYGGVDKLVNEDNELLLAYKTQKDLNRLLQTHLDKTEKELRGKEKQWTAVTEELRKENDILQNVYRQGLTLSPETRLELTVQHEIERIMTENLDLRESVNKQADQIDKLNKMLTIYAKKLKGGEAEIAKELDKESSGSTVASVIHREKGGRGMLEYKKEDVPILVRNLILDLKPQLATTFTPGLPAYILFMCVLHTDHVNDDEKIKTLLNSTIGGIRNAVKSHSDDLDCITLWLANSCRLLHTLKQYSGDKQYQTENTPKQNEKCLRNFDLSEYRQVISDLAVWTYQMLIKKMEEQIQPCIVPAILEHEGIAGLTASKPSGLRGRSSSIVNELDEGKDSKQSLNLLEEMLHNYMLIFKQHQVDQELIRQIFRQLFYYMCANTLNNLLLRKDMCNWSKGMQIRYNLNHLEQWLRDNHVHESGAAEKLEPIVEASQLLQARKTESDVDSICEMCSKLTTAQIVKILNIYTPVDEFEERVPSAFIRKIQAKLKQREPQKTAHNTLLMDTKFNFPVTFPFSPSSVALETISVPEKLHLDFLILH